MASERLGGHGRYLKPGSGRSWGIRVYSRVQYEREREREIERERKREGGRDGYVGPSVDIVQAAAWANLLCRALKQKPCMRTSLTPSDPTSPILAPQ